MGWASEDFFIDVSTAAVRPTSLAVVDLAAVAGHGAAGKGTAAVARVKDDPLASRGEAFGAAEVQRFALMVFEDRKVMERVAGHANDVCHRKQGSAGGDNLSSDIPPRPWRHQL